jgi:hypothetical protein
MGDQGVTQRTFVLSYDDCPKSINAGGTGSRRHWGSAYKEKRHWEGIWGMLLLGANAPRHMVRCEVEGLLEFKHANRRDVENYRSSLTKPLADALVSGGWLADDTNDFFRLIELDILSGVELPRKARTTVKILAVYDAT